MRITREILLKSARETAAQRVRNDRRLICIFLTGSLLQKDPLLGGTTDIDLVIVHEEKPLDSREVVGLSEDVSLDIQHYSQSSFSQPRRLRSDPFLGPLLYNFPTLLHDIQHWFEFVQASASAQFTLPQYALERARALAENARQGWNALYQPNNHNLPERLLAYFNILEQSGSSIAALTGLPLPERHFFTQLTSRADQLQRPELCSRLAELLAPQPPSESDWQNQWLPAWTKAYRACAAQPLCPPQIHGARYAYYAKAMQTLWPQNPTAALWLLLRTWGLAISQLPPESEHYTVWQSTLPTLELDDEHLENRMETLDQYLDLLEETLDDWAQRNGV